MTEHLKLAEAERRRKEEAERKAKLDEIAEKQRQRERELEEKEKQWKETILGPSRPVETFPASNPVEPVVAAAAAAAAAPAAAPASINPGRYVPKFLRERTEGPGAAPPPEADRWGGRGRQDDRFSQPSDRWRNDERRPSAFGSGSSGSRSSWSSSRPSRGGER